MCKDFFQCKLWKISLDDHLKEGYKWLINPLYCDYVCSWHTEVLYISVIFGTAGNGHY